MQREAGRGKMSGEVGQGGGVMEWGGRGGVWGGTGPVMGVDMSVLGHFLLVAGLPEGMGEAESWGGGLHQGAGGWACLVEV